jgi:hypothetical protein
MKHTLYFRKILRNLLPLFFVLTAFAPAKAFSILSHQAVIDAAWDSTIRPLLLYKFPGTPDSVLNNAKAFAYGGVIMPDMGYFPFGSVTFTNLLHYTRSGDFYETLLSEAKDLNEYAFALGALAHYYGDIEGHPLGTNPSVPMVYPKVKKEYGPVATYEQDPLAHRRMELAFDVLQVARGSYASKAYHDFIGFELSKELMERTFFKVYGLEMKELFINFRVAVGSFRWSVKELFPLLTQVAWRNKKKDIAASNPGVRGKNFRYRMSRNTFHKEWGAEYQRQGFGARFLSLFIRFMPKVGPLAPLRFRIPTPDSEKLFIAGFNAALLNYTNNARRLRSGALNIKNLNLDTGKPATFNEYKLSDECYSELLLKHEKTEFVNMNAGLQKALLSFFREFKNTGEDDEKVAPALLKLKNLKF